MKKYMILLVSIIIIIVIIFSFTNREITVTTESLSGKWQFNGSTDMQKFYKKHGNGMYASMNINGEIMKAGHLFLDGSYLEFKQNNIASFESDDVKYEIHKLEGNFQVKFIDNEGVESTHFVKLTSDTLHIDYFTLDKISDDVEINKPITIDMSSYTFSSNDLGITAKENNQLITLGMSKTEVDRILGQGIEDKLYYDYNGLKIMYVQDEVAALILEKNNIKNEFSLDRNIKLGDSQEDVLKAFGEPTYKKYSWETYAFKNTYEDQKISYVNLDDFLDTNEFSLSTITFVYTDKKTEIESITVAYYYYGFQYW